jgi:hypothetical protein
MESTIEQITAYLATRGFDATREDEAEIVARMKGHASAEAHRAFDAKAQVFTAYHGDLNDFDTEGNFSGERTRTTPTLCEGAKDMVLRFAFLEANASEGFTVVYDGNGTLIKTFEETGKNLALYYALGRDMKDPEAKFRDELAEDSDMIEFQMNRWREVGQQVARFRAASPVNNNGVPLDNAMLYVVEDGNQKILWRSRF